MCLQAACHLPMAVGVHAGTCSHLLPSPCLSAPWTSTNSLLPSACAARRLMGPQCWHASASAGNQPPPASLAHWPRLLWVPMSTLSTPTVLHRLPNQPPTHVHIPTRFPFKPLPPLTCSASWLDFSLMPWSAPCLSWLRLISRKSSGRAELDRRPAAGRQKLAVALKSPVR